ncbi:prepilin-type N-terminal cleavage/methylation domain-containing protein [bacterium]|nr:prepilin-type N-terminal cleavage/methylation domain-containing protein [bacterium]
MTMPTFLRRTNHKAGFTLIEILLVVALVGLLASALVPNISGVFRVGLKSSVRRFSAVVKYTYDNSILTGRIHRIVLDLDKQTWRVEAANPGQLPTDKDRMGLLPDSLREDDRVIEDPAFTLVGARLVENIPAGVKIMEASSWRLGEGNVVDKGEFFIYAYPNGLIDEATVVIVEEGKEKLQQFIVTTKSLTGRVKVKTENKPIQ